MDPAEEKLKSILFELRKPIQNTSVKFSKQQWDKMNHTLALAHIAREIKRQLAMTDLSGMTIPQLMKRLCTEYRLSNKDLQTILQLEEYKVQKLEQFNLSPLSLGTNIIAHFVTAFEIVFSNALILIKNQLKIINQRQNGDIQAFARSTKSPGSMQNNKAIQDGLNAFLIETTKELKNDDVPKDFIEELKREIKRQQAIILPE